MFLAPIVSALLLTSPALEDALVDAQKLIEQAQWQEAQQLLQATLDEGTDDERGVRLALAAAHVGGGSPDVAIDTLDPVDTGKDVDVSLQLGKAYLALADMVAAQGASPDDITATLTDARSHFEHAVGYAPAEDPAALVALGNCELYRFGDYWRALEIADSGLGAVPDNAELLLLRGCARVYDYWNLAQSGDDAGANESWNAAVDDLLAADKGLSSERVEAWGQLAWLYETKGIPSKAVAAAIKIVDRQPEPNYDTLYRLAERYASERRFDASGKALEKIVSLNAREITMRVRASENKDQTATLLSWAVEPFNRRSDFATARSILAAVVAADPTDPTIWDNYAYFCQATRRYDEAVEAYEHRLELDDSDPRAFNDLAAVLHHDLERDFDKAAEMYRRCISMADEQLTAADLSDDRRSYLSEARRVAQGNLDDLEPPKGLLDSVLDGLSSLSVPDLPDDDEDESPEGEDAGDTSGT